MTTPVVVADAVRAWAARAPGRLAIRDGKRRLDYASLVARIDRAANAAAGALGLVHGDRAAIVAPNCLELVELMFGLATIGVVLVPIDATTPPRELAKICDDAEARALFVHPSLETLSAEAEPASVERTVVLGDEYERLLQDARATPAGVPVKPDEPFVLLYTSGTTGGAKGVLLSHRSKTLLFPAVAAEYGCFGPDDRTLAVAPLTHAAGFLYGLTALSTGGSCTLLPLFHPKTVLGVIESERITNVFLASAHLRMLLELAEPFPVPSLRALVCGAAPVDYATKERIVERFGNGVLHESYGATEAGVIAMLRPEDQLTRRESVGRPFAGVSVSLVDDEGKPVSDGEIGELCVRSPYLFDSYWRRPDETAAVLRDGAYTAGDVARIDEEGYIYLLDRKHDKIISGGLNFYPAEVELVLARHEAVDEAVAFGVPDERLGEVVRAAVTVVPGRSIDVRELLALCARTLPPHKRPREVEVVDSLPRSANGKVLRRALRDPHWAGRTRNIA